MYEDLHELVLAVDVVVGAVARVAHLLHHFVVQVAHAEAETGHVDTLAGVALYHLDYSISTGDAYVEVAVGAHNDAVVGLRVIVLQGLLVGHLQGLTASGAAIGPQLADGTLDFIGMTDARRFQQLLDLAGVGDNRDAVVGVQLVEQFGESLLQQVEFVAAIHRT